jgi:peptidoglycan/xylan/chitin deacetylase (PgdA/CDA1 family)
MQLTSTDHSPAPTTARRMENEQGREAGLRWPGGAGLAVSFVLNIEEGGEFSLTAGDARNESVHEVVNEIVGAPDYCMETHFEYGMRAGYARVVERFAKHGWPLTLNVCGRALQQSPWIAEDAQARGFEMCAHGWRWESPALMSEVEERTAITKTVQTIEQIGGRAPAGWHSKSSRSVRTRELLFEHPGFFYDSDDYGGDIPYLLKRPDGQPHVVLPYAFDTNDMRFFDKASFVQGRDFGDYVIEAVNVLRQEAAQVPRMLTIGLHTRIIGRPGRIHGLDMILDELAKHPQQVWVARREDIARHWLTHAKS